MSPCRLLSDLDGLDWADSIKEMQRNWIGRSEGASIRFKVAPGDGAAVAAGELLLVGSGVLWLAHVMWRHKPQLCLMTQGGGLARLRHGLLQPRLQARPHLRRSLHRVLSFSLPWLLLH